MISPASFIYQLLSLSEAKMPRSSGRWAFWDVGWRRRRISVRIVSFLYRFFLLLLFSPLDPPPKWGQHEGVIIVHVACAGDSCVSPEWPLSLHLTSSAPFLLFSFVRSPGSAHLLTKIGNKLQSTGPRRAKKNVSMDFLFWTPRCYCSTAKSSIPAAQRSAVWDVRLIRNTVESSTLPLDRHRGYLPPWDISQGRL